MPHPHSNPKARGRRKAAGLPYSEALAEIYALDKFGSQLGLDRIREMLSSLGNPQQSFRCVLVGGSNGKGSTVEMAGAILHSAGFRVGTYFSPQVLEFPERMRINGKNAPRQEISWAYQKVRDACRRNGIRATFFEVVTAMALLVFEKRRVFYAVLEVGLGGRLDATNAVEPEISAISSLSLEHTAVLGPTISHIAHEKCGIGRRGKKLVCGILGEDAKNAVRAECGFLGASVLFVEDEARLSGLRQEGNAYSFMARYQGGEFHIRLRAPGRYQISNACLALALCHELGASPEAIEKGLSKCKIAFRMQTISDFPQVIADCCHNPEAAFALASEAERLQAERKVLVFSAMKDKDYRQVLRVLKSHFDAVALCQVSLPRAASLSELKAVARKEGLAVLGEARPKTAAIRAGNVEGAAAFAFRKPAEALAFAKGFAGKGGCVFIAGSIYLLAELFGKDKTRIAQ